MSLTTLAVLIILLALLFDFLNGMNDAANSIATIVSTRVLSPKLAVAWAALFNFIAAFAFGVGVAKTIGKESSARKLFLYGLFWPCWPGPSPGPISAPPWGCRSACLTPLWVELPEQVS